MVHLMITTNVCCCFSYFLEIICVSVIIYCDHYDFCSHSLGLLLLLLIFTRVSAVNVDVYGCYERYPWYFIGLLLLLLIFSGTVITIVDILPVSLPLLFIYPENTTVSCYLHRWLLLTNVTAVIHVYMDYSYLQLTSSCIIIVSTHVS